MIPASSFLSLYFSRNSSAPEKATSLMYFLTSSDVMPTPLSIIWSVFSFLFTLISNPKFPISPFTSPILLIWLSFVNASVAFETSSLKKIS